MYRFLLALISMTFVFSINAQDVQSEDSDEPKVEVSTLSGEEVIEVMKPMIWGLQVDGNNGDDCVVDLLIASDNGLAMLVFRDEKGAPINYTESNQNNPGTFWFAHGYNYIYTKTDF
ncbi:MAG: hypothetical protein HRT44_12845, partial [Bdellovibrionales bacterium]|nr:hypothetical protein [Bdellovibrionales bacterium]NQZ20124.1 hypothetical protein [Bdellovibrionales bacterium]